MGKRELFIVLGFIVVGTLAFQFTAAPATGTSSFSLSNFFKEARREIRGNPGNGTFTTKVSVAVPAGTREVRLIGINDGVTVIGDARETIDYEFTVNSTGADDAAAVGHAKQTQLNRDDVGDSMILRAKYPEHPSTQRSTLTLRLPARLTVRVESGSEATVSGVAGVHLEGMRSDVTLTDVAGAVTGAHQDGDLTITGARSAKLRLLRTKSKMSKITDGLVLDLRDTDSEVTDSGGAIEVDELRSELSVSGHRGSVTVRGSDGTVNIQRPQGDTRVDVRRAEVEVLVEHAVPLTIITTEEPLRLILAGTPAFTLDAATTSAAIQAVDFDLKPESSGTDARLSHVFGAKSSVRISLRNTRGDIVIRKNP